MFWGGTFPLLRTESRAELERLLANWQVIVDASPRLIIPGHSDVPMTLEYFRNAQQYVSRLWAHVQAARAAGTPLLTFLMQNPLRDVYPEVAQYPVVRREYNLHQQNVNVLWHLAGR